MAKLSDVRAAHPARDQDVYDAAYADAQLAGRVAAMAYGLRTSAGLTQKQLADIMGTSQSAIARLENAGAVPTLEFLGRLASAAGVDLTLAAGDQSAVVVPLVQHANVSTSASTRGRHAPDRKAVARKQPAKKVAAKGSKRTRA